MTPALRLRNICFGYIPGRPILDDLTLDIVSGRVYALLGANGSGKSTLLKLMAGTLQPQKGQIELEGLALAALGRRAIARRLAVVPQAALASGFLTVRELVMLGRHPWQGWFASETPRDRGCVEQALSAVALKALAGRRVEDLSGGEQQRAQVAMALAQSTRLLLLDEPTSHLDVRHQIELLDLLAARAGGNGRTIVMVLHDLNLAAAYADRLVLLHAGRVLAEGPPGTVLTPEYISAAYGLEAMVLHGASGRPHVVLRPGRRTHEAAGPRVHIIGGGGAAANLLSDLVARGYRLSLGVLNQGDLDAVIASDLQLEPVLLPPACPVTQAAYEQSFGQALASRAVVVANIPFGAGNLDNLRLALAARQAGLPVLLVAEDPVAARDFTGGKAAAMIGELLAAGAEAVEREQMVGERLEELLGRS